LPNKNTITIRVYRKKNTLTIKCLEKHHIYPLKNPQNPKNASCLTCHATIYLCLPV
jgi:hypothetical protein